MKLATRRTEKGSAFCVAPKGKMDFVDFEEVKKDFPQDKLIQAIQTLDEYVQRAEWVHSTIQSKESVWAQRPAKTLSSFDFVLPFKPLQFRDFYCFEEHVKNGRRSRGLEMIPEWYEIPVFYYSNHLSIQGPNVEVEFPGGSEKLDFELEIGCVIGSKIRNANVEQAQKAILGYCLVNDWTARDFQSQEMKLNMGPHKGKDFSTTFGPFIVTPDEFSGREKGKGFDVNVELLWNGRSVVKNNWSKIQFSFAEMLVRASKNCDVYPGELLGSGTVGMGSLMEHNLDKTPAEWIQRGDEIELRMDEAIVLKNKVI